jgi:hypothetical protein
VTTPTIAPRKREQLAGRFFVEGRRVDEGTFWGEVERLARAGARARVTPEEVRWRLTPRGEAVARLIRRQRVTGEGA